MAYISQAQLDAIPTSATPHKKKQGFFGNLLDDVGSLGNVFQGIADDVISHPLKDLAEAGGVAAGLGLEALGGALDLTGVGAIAGVPLNILGAGMLGGAGFVAGNALGGGHVASSIAKQYNYTYGPALSGDFGTTAERIKAHPLGPILDVLALASGGASLAGRAGEAATLGHLGQGAADFARSSGVVRGATGLEKVSDLSSLAPTNWDPETAGFVKDPAYFHPDGSMVPNELRADLGLHQDPILASIKGAKTSTDGDYYMPRVTTVRPRAPEGEVPRGLEVTHPGNAYLYRKNLAMAKLGARLPNAPLVGLAGRITRQDLRRIASQTSRSAGGLYQEWSKAEDNLGNGSSAPLADIQHAFLGDMPLGQQIKYFGQRLGEVDTHDPGNGSVAFGKSPEQVAQLQADHDFAQTVVDQAARPAEETTKEYNSRLFDLKEAKDKPALAALKREIAAVNSARKYPERLEGHVARMDEAAQAIEDHHQALHTGPFLKARHEELSSPLAKAVQYALSGNEGALRAHLSSLSEDEQKRIGEIATPENMAKLRKAINLSQQMEQQVITPWIAQLRSNPLTGKVGSVDEHALSTGIGAMQRRALGDTSEEEALHAAVAHDQAVLMKQYGLTGDRPFLRTTQMQRSPVAAKAFATSSKNEARGAGLGRGYITVRDALDATKPEATRSIYHQAHAATLYRQKFNAGLAQSVSVPVDKAIEFASKNKGYVPLADHGSTAYMKAAMQSMYEFVNNDAKVMFGDAPMFDDVSNSLERFAAAANEQGKVLFIPKSVNKELFREAKRSTHFISKFYDWTNEMWRNYTLGLRPAWMTNNLLGNVTLLMLSQGPFKALRSLIEAGLGKDQLGIIGKHLGTERADGINFMTPDIIQSAYTHVVLDDAKRTPSDFLESAASRAFGTNIANHLATAGHVLNPGTWARKALQFNAAAIDDPFRRAAFWGELRPAVKRLQKAYEQLHGEPLAEPDAIQMVMQDQGVVDHMTTKTLNDMVNFRDLSINDRSRYRQIMPFWSWISGITKRTGRLFVDDPIKARALVALGEKGQADNKKFYGQTQDFIDNYLHLGGKKGGRVSVINEAAINPFATVADVASMIKPLAQGDLHAFQGTGNPLSSFSPLAKSALETLTGNNLLIGGPLQELTASRGGNPDMNRGELFANRFFKNFPMYSSADKFFSPSTAKMPLMRNSPEDLLLSYFVAPHNQLNLTAAQRDYILQLKDDAKLRRKKKKTS